MSNDEIRESLDKLRIELNALGEGDGGVRDRLNGIIDGLEKQLENPGKDPGHESLVERISGTVEEFETDHPNIAGILGNIMSSLSNMGI